MDPVGSLILGFHLEAMNLDEIYVNVINPEDIIMDGNKVSQKDCSKAIIFICFTPACPFLFYYDGKYTSVEV